MKTFFLRLRGWLFHNKGIASTVTKNFFWLLTSNFGGRAIRGLLIVYAARVLGASQYGVVSYAFSLAGFFLFVKNIGIDSILMREIAKHPDERKEYLSTAFWIEVMLLVITAFLLLVVAPRVAHVPEAIGLFPLVAAFLIFEDMRELLLAVVRGLEKMEVEALIIMIGNVVMAGTGFVLLRTSPTPHALLVAYLLGSLVALGLVVIAVWEYLRGVLTHFRKDFIRPLFKASWPIAFSGLAGMFLANVDVVMLGWWKVTSDIGLYAAGQKLVGVLGALPGALGTAVFPVFARLVGNDQRGHMEILGNHVFRVMFLAALPLVVGGALVAGPFVRFIFGSGYDGAGGVFTIMLISLLATYPTTVIFTILFAHNRQRETVLYAIITSLLNVGLNFFMIPRYGMYGAAWANLISLVVYALLSWYSVRRLGSFYLFKGTSKIFLATFFMATATGVFMNFWHLPVVAVIIFAAIVYGAALFLLKEPLLEEAFILFRK